MDAPLAHKEQLEFITRVRDAYPDQFQGARVLEIGSLDINGSIRGFFQNCDYLGLDVAEGRGVDLVCEGQVYEAPNESFDLVISCEAMEHNPFWRETMTNMIRLVRPGGLVIMSCATIGRPEHGTARSEPSSSPLTVAKGWNYYRNLTRDDLRDGVDMTPLGAWRTAENWKSFDLYFVGIKSPAGVRDQEWLAAIFDPYNRKYWATWKWIRRSVRERLKSKLTGPG